MYKFSDVTSVQIEISNNCQAACPMCARNVHSGIENPLIKVNNWTIDDFKKIFTKDIICQFKKIMFCGVFGDPIMNNDLIDMCFYIKETSPDTEVNINTNGSARSAEWWKKLTLSMPKHHSIIFGIDGTDQQTHALHRVNTSYETIIKNAKIVIYNGGNAAWHFIRFKHNEDQVEKAKEISKNLGFSSFILKDTRRFMQDRFPVLNKNGEIEYYLDRTTHNNIPVANVLSIKDYKNWNEHDQIYCYSKIDKEIYIDSDKLVFPCCIIPAFKYTNYDNNFFGSIKESLKEINEIGNQIKTDVSNLINEIGDKDKINAISTPLDVIINSETWQAILEKKWKENGSMCCTAMCSKNSPFIKIIDQFSDQT